LLDDLQSKNGVAILMDWTRILGDAGIAESPGRSMAIALAQLATAERYAEQGHKRAKGTNTAKTKKVARMDYKATK
jgi:hypothetical protein